MVLQEVRLCLAKSSYSAFNCRHVRMCAGQQRAFEDRHKIEAFLPDTGRGRAWAEIAVWVLKRIVNFYNPHPMWNLATFSKFSPCNFW